MAYNLLRMGEFILFDYTTYVSVHSFLDCGSRIPVTIEKIRFRRGNFTPLFVRDDGADPRLPAAWTKNPFSNSVS
jgi:hypothetical protein